LPIRERERRAVAIATLLAGEHLPHAPVDRILRSGRQRVERGGVDLVAARVLEQAALEIEIVQRASLRVARSRRGEALGEGRRSLHTIGERRFVDEEQV